MNQQERNYTANLIRTLRSNGVAVRLANDGELTDVLSRESPSNKIDFLKTKDDNIYGWFSNSSIHLTENGFNPNTPLHEYTHAFMLAMSNEQPERYANIVNALKSTNTWKEVKSDSAYSNISENETRIASEVAARIVGKESERRASESMPDKIMRALQDLLDYIKEKLGLQTSFTPRTFTNAVIKDISNPDNTVSNIRFEAQFDNSKTNNIPSIVHELLQQNHGKEYADAVSKVVDMTLEKQEGNLLKSYPYPEGLLSQDVNYNHELAKAATLVTGDQYSFNNKDVITYKESEQIKTAVIPDDMVEYVSSLKNRTDLHSGDVNLLPKALSDKYSKWEAASEEYISMKEGGLSAIVDLKAQRNLVSETFQDYRKSLYDHLGIDFTKNNSVTVLNERNFTKNGETIHDADFQLILLDKIRDSIDKEVEANKNFVLQNHVEMMVGRTANSNMNINDLVFSRTQPDKKLEIIKGMSDSEIMRLTEDSAIKMVKEAGRAIYKSRDKELNISRSNRAGNQWNSTIDSFYTHKGKLQLSAYIQYENTDTNDSESYSKFFGKGDYEGQFRALDRRGNERSYYYTYDEHDKANVLRSLLLEYVNVKYAKKLEEKNANQESQKVGRDKSPEVKIDSKSTEENKQKVESSVSQGNTLDTRTVKELVSQESKMSIENMFKPYNLDSNEKIDNMIEQFKALDSTSAEINIARLERLKELRTEASKIPKQLDLFKDQTLTPSKNKQLYDEVCDEAEKKIIDAGYGHGYAEDLGIGLGEYIYDKNPDNELNHFEFITPEGKKFEAMYDTWFDEVSFTSGVVRGGMYETSVDEWKEALDKNLHPTLSVQAEPVQEIKKEELKNERPSVQKKSKESDGRSYEDKTLDTFAELMISKIESIQSNWQKPWFTPGASQPPKNLSGREYNGMNSIILMMQQEKHGWESNRFATFERIISLNFDKDKQEAKDADGNVLPNVHVNKGEKSTPVYLTTFTVVDPETKEKINYFDYKEMTDEERAKYNVFPKLHIYNVFNLDQTNMKEARPEMYEKFLNETKGEIRPSSEGMTSFPAIDTMIDKNLWYCPIKPTKGDDAYYSISKDEIVIPVKEQFKDGESFYSNLFHEMAHSTGAQSRIDRLKPTSFGSKEYAKEELVAELTAAFISSKHGMAKGLKEDSAAYLKSWLDSLKQDPKFIKTTLMDVKKASSMLENRILLVEQKLEQGEKADYSDIKEQNKTNSPKFDSSQAKSINSPSADNNQEEASKVVEAERQQEHKSHGFHR